MQSLLYCISLFTISEILLLIAKRSKKTSAKSRGDGRSLLLFWITIPTCLAAGYFIAAYRISMPIAYAIAEKIAIAIFTVGFIIRWFSIFQLGKMFTVDVSISSAHILKTDGLYKLVRHPSYLGLILIITGIAFFMGNVLSILVTVIPIFLVTNYRISVEEKALTEEFGEQYLMYKQRVKKIIPLIY